MILSGNNLNLATAITQKTWAQLGWTSSNISTVFFFEPENQGVILQSWDPSQPFSPLPGIKVGGQYIIQPKSNITNNTDFYEYAPGDTPQSTTLKGNQLNVRTASATLTWFNLGWNST